MKTGLVAGLTGDICAGKSSVSALLKECGARVWDADAYVRALFERGDVKNEVVALCGPGVLDAQGNVDRGAISRLVFQDSPALLERLTREIIYPRTGEAIRQSIAEFRASADAPLLLVDAPTLFESGSNALCDRIIWIGAPPDVRERWAMDNRGWVPGEIARREARLLPAAQKKARCDAVIENSGSKEDLQHNVRQLWKQWTGS